MVLPRCSKLCLWAEFLQCRCTGSIPEQHMPASVVTALFSFHVPPWSPHPCQCQLTVSTAFPLQPMTEYHKAPFLPSWKKLWSSRFKKTFYMYHFSLSQGTEQKENITFPSLQTRTNTILWNAFTSVHFTFFFEASYSNYYQAVEKCRVLDGSSLLHRIALIVILFTWDGELLQIRSLSYNFICFIQSCSSDLLFHK